MWGFTEPDIGARRRPLNPFELDPEDEVHVPGTIPTVEVPNLWRPGSTTGRFMTPPAHAQADLYVSLATTVAPPDRPDGVTEPPLVEQPPPCPRRGRRRSGFWPLSPPACRGGFTLLRLPFVGVHSGESRWVDLQAESSSLLLLSPAVGFDIALSREQEFQEADTSV